MIFQQSLLYFFLLFFYFLVMRKVAHLNKWGAVGSRPYPFCAARVILHIIHLSSFCHPKIDVALKITIGFMIDHH
jgi:hypothetical protein